MGRSQPLTPHWLKMCGDFILAGLSPWRSGWWTFLGIVPPGNMQISQKLNLDCESKWDFMHGVFVRAPK